MKRCRLNTCPPGLFLFEGTLCFRSGYSTTLENPKRWQCDAYVVESGEYFWGGAKDTEARGNLMVEPIPRKAIAKTLLPALRARTLHPLSSDTEGMVK